MRVRIIWFVFGSIVTLWVNANMSEVDAADVAAWAAVVQWFDGGGIDFNHDVIEEALEPYDVDVDEPFEPGANWLNEASPRFRPA